MNNKKSWEDIYKEYHLFRMKPGGYDPMVLEVWLEKNYNPPIEKVNK